MKRVCAVACCVLALGGCYSKQFKSSDTYERVSSELKQAADTKVAPASDEAVNRALIPPLVLEMPKMGTAVEPKFDLAVNNAPANQVFLAIVSGTRYSMLVHPDVKEPISVNLKDVTVPEALDAIRDLYGYDYRIQGNRILVQPLGLQTRVFQVNYLMGRRQGRADVRITSGSIQTPTPTVAGVTTAGGVPTPAIGSGGTTAQSLESSRITTTSDVDYWSDLASSVRAIIGCDPGAAPGSAVQAASAGSTGASPSVASQSNIGCRDGRSVVINPQSGVIVVRGYPAEVRSVETFLRQMQIIVDRQVMLEAKILDVQLSDAFQAGINWALFKTGPNSRFSAGQATPGSVIRTDGPMNSSTARGLDGQLLPGATVAVDPARALPISPDPLSLIPGAIGSVSSALVTGPTVPGSVFGLAFQSANFAALLEFLETQGTVHVLSSPRIATLNNQKAVLKVGNDEFFVTNISTTTSTTGTVSTVSPTITVQPFFSGIALDVTPQIAEDNQIILHVHPSVSLVTDKTKTLNLGSLGFFTLPLASSNVNESDTIVRVGDGSIVAIGGLMRQRQTDNRSQLPGLGDLPGIGNLFRSTDQNLQKSELVILIKTTVIHGSESWREQTQEASQRMQGLQRAPFGEKGAAPAAPR